MNWEKLKFLGLESIWFGGFCSIWFKLMKSACLLNWFGHYKLFSIMYNDQFGQFVGFVKLDFSNFGVFDVNSMLKPILSIWSTIELILIALEHASYRTFIYLFFLVLTCSLPFVFFLIFFSLFCVCPLILSIMVRKTRAHRTSTSTSSPTFDNERFLSEKNQEAMTSWTFVGIFGLRERYS